MERIASWRYAEAIGEALRIIGPGIGRYLRCDFLTGVNPVYAGLHRHIIIEQDGPIRYYADTAHCHYPESGIPTVALPLDIDAEPLTIVHELGHVLDWVLGFTHTARAIDAYATIDRLEAFAQMFTAHYFYLGDEAEALYQSDKRTLALFDRLEEGMAA